MSSILSLRVYYRGQLAPTPKKIPEPSHGRVKSEKFYTKNAHFEFCGLKIRMEAKICQNHIQNILGLTAQPQEVWVF